MFRSFADIREKRSHGMDVAQVNRAEVSGTETAALLRERHDCATLSRILEFDDKVGS